LDGGADDVANGAVIAEINHFDSMADEFEINCVDRAVVAITNGDCGQNSNWRRHLFQEITTNLESRKTGKLKKCLYCLPALLIHVHRFGKPRRRVRVRWSADLRICINWCVSPRLFLCFLPCGFPE